MEASFKRTAKDCLLTFLKGIVVGLGAIAPGLSGSLLLIIFGLYQKIVNTVSNFFKNIKKNLLFLVPLALGIGVGIILFAKLINPISEAYPIQTNYTFLGLIIGAFPALLKEVRREGFKKKYYIFMAVSLVLGATFLWFFGAELAGEADTDPGFLKSVLLGVAVSCAYLIPGVDSCAILSTFGLYGLWMDSIDSLNFKVLLPAVIGLAAGGIVISLIFNKLLAEFYTGTYSIVFGLFIAVVLNFIYRGIYTDGNTLAEDGIGAIAAVFIIAGALFSFAFSNIDKIIKHFKRNSKEKATGDSSCDTENGISDTENCDQSADSEPVSRAEAQIELGEGAENDSSQNA